MQHDGFYELEALDILSPFTKISHRSGCDIGEHRLIIPNKKTIHQHKLRMTREELEQIDSPVYDIDAECGSWVRKAWNIAGRMNLPSPDDSGFKNDPHYIIPYIVRIVYQFRIHSGKKKNNIGGFVYKYPYGSYGSIDNAKELYNVIDTCMRALYKYGKDGYPADKGFIKTITVFQDATYDTFQGNVFKYIEGLGIKINTYYKKWEIK